MECPGSHFPYFAVCAPALECSEECLSNDLLLILFSSDFIAFTGKYEITKFSYPQIYTEMKCFLLNGKIALFVSEAFSSQEKTEGSQSQSQATSQTSGSVSAAALEIQSRVPRV